jgi:predicted transcriptional regulator
MPRSFAQLLEEVTSEKAPGPSPTFSVFHMVLAIELIAKKPIGRNALAERLKIGEGAVRTIISRLRDADLIATSKAGCSLTKKGVSVWKEYTSILKKFEIGKSELTEADCNSVVLIRDQEHKLRAGMEQRDAAIKAGAKNATTIVFKQGRLIIPSVSENVVETFPQAANQIFKLMKPDEQDVIIIVGADTPEKAEYGALAAAWTLIANY